MSQIKDEIPCSPRTLMRWRKGERVINRKTVKVWPTWDERTRDNRGSFHLGQLEDSELGWASGPYLLELWKHLKTYRGDSQYYGFWTQKPSPALPVELTLLEAIWAWRLHQLDVDLEFDEIYALALLCSERQSLVKGPVQAEKNVYGDVQAFLSFKPWLSTENHIAYIEAYSRHIIDPLEFEQLEFVVRLKLGYVPVRPEDGLPKRQRKVAFDYSSYRDFVGDEDAAPGTMAYRGLPTHPKPSEMLAFRKLTYMIYASRAGQTFEEDKLRREWNLFPPATFDYTRLRSVAPMLMWQFLDNRKDKDRLARLVDSLPVDLPSAHDAKALMKSVL